MNSLKNIHGYNMINEVINCNTIKMKDGSKWVEWYLEQRNYIPKKNLDRIVFILNEGIKL